MWNFVLLVFFHFVAGDFGHHVNPGLQVRLSQHGLQYAADVATDLLAKRVKTLDIPDQSGHANVKVGKVQYEFSHIRLKTFKPSDSTISTDPITWSLHKTSVAMTAKWWYKYTLGSIDIKDSGSLDLSLDLHLTASVVLGADTRGHATMHSKSCSSSVTHVDVHFHGGASWLYNLFASQADDAIQSAIKQQLCLRLKQFIDEQAAEELATLPVVVDVYDDVMLDYSLVDKPRLTSTFIDIMFKGEFFWKTDKQDYPFAAHVIDTNITHTRMVNFWVTDYAINTLCYAAFKHDVLMYNLTRADLPKAEQFTLNTTCPTGLPCIGKLIPQIGKLYPNSYVVLRMRVTSAPIIDVSKHLAQTNWTGVVDYHVNLPNGTSSKFMFSTSLDVQFDLKVKLEKLNVTAQIQDFRLNMSLIKSSIGSVNVSLLRSVIDLVVKVFVIPRLNAVGATGLRLPSLDHVSYEHAELQWVRNALFVAADIEHDEEPSTSLTFGNMTLHLKV